MRVHKNLPKMSEVKALRLKEKILMIELESIRKQIAIYDESLEATTVESVQEGFGLKTDIKDTVSPCSGKNDKVSPLLKGDTSSDEQSSPSPVANGSGKDSSNPLRADNLPKIVEDNLRPTYADKANAPAADTSKWYVIFNGEHRGLYDSWPIVSKYVTGTTAAYKKYSNLIQARKEAEKYTAVHGGPEIRFKGYIPEPIKGFTNRQTVFPVPKAREEPATKIEDEYLGIDFDVFRTLWSKARNASEEDYEHEKFYTDDKKTKSLFVFCPDADENLVYLAFKAGLTKCIYPSKNLQEIKLFPKHFREAVKKFRTKVAAAKDADIYIQFTSTLPSWEIDALHPAYHYVEVGIAKQRTVTPSKAMDESQDFMRRSLNEVRADGFIQILQKTQKIKPDQLSKVNYFSWCCVIVSNSGSPLSMAENKSIKIFEDKILDNEIVADPTTKTLLCKKLKQIIEHSCKACERTLSPAASESSSTREDKDD